MPEKSARAAANQKNDQFCPGYIATHPTQMLTPKRLAMPRKHLPMYPA